MNRVYVKILFYYFRAEMKKGLNREEYHQQHQMNLNIYQADNLGCQIITVPHNLLSKLSNIGKNLEKFSLETVLGFYKDAKSAGYSINSKKKND